MGGVSFPETDKDKECRKDRERKNERRKTKGRETEKEMLKLC